MGRVRERFPEDLLRWSEDNIRDFPWRRDDASPYEILVAEMFLNVTRSDVVAGIYPRFVEAFPDPEALQTAEREELVETIRPMGLYNRRADALEELADILVEGGLPDERDELLALPRVGQYVADAVLCMAYEEDGAMIDRNVARVYSRLFGVDLAPSRISEEERDWLESLVPEGEAKRYNLALLDFASEVCKARTPRCGECFAEGYCDYPDAPDVD